MPTWEYDIVIGPPGDVLEELNRLGALGWEIATTDVLPGSPDEPMLVVYMKRCTEPQAPESRDGDLTDFAVFRPHT